MRKITVNGHMYKYKVGKTYTKFDTGVAVANWELAGLDYPDTFDRGQWKRTSDGMVTPKMVANFLLRLSSVGRAKS